jgi:hypothetical protein
MALSPPSLLHASCPGPPHPSPCRQAGHKNRALGPPFLRPGVSPPVSPLPAAARVQVATSASLSIPAHDSEVAPRLTKVPMSHGIGHPAPRTPRTRSPANELPSICPGLPGDPAPSLAALRGLHDGCIPLSKGARIRHGLALPSEGLHFRPSPPLASAPLRLLRDGCIAVSQGARLWHGLACPHRGCTLAPRLLSPPLPSPPAPRWLPI